MIEPTTDRATVDRILQHPAIASRIRHDFREPGYIDHPLVTHLLATVNGEPAGVFLAVQFSDLEVELHAAVLPQFIRHGRALGRECLAHVFGDPAVMRATAYVIEGLESAANYCRRLGFITEGFRRDACRKDGRLVGVHVLGITRADFERTSP